MVQNCNNYYELCHTGRKGMKWYQHIFTNPDGSSKMYKNSDGTLTPLGTKKAAKLAKEYSKVTGGRNIKKARVISKDDKKEQDDIKKEEPKRKKLSEMSNKEIEDGIYRMKIEMDYREKYNNLNPQKISKGKAFVDEVLLPAGKTASKKALEAYLEKQIKNALGVKKNN